MYVYLGTYNVIFAMSCWSWILQTSISPDLKLCISYLLYKSDFESVVVEHFMLLWSFMGVRRSFVKTHKGVQKHSCHERV